MGRLRLFVDHPDRGSASVPPEARLRGRTPILHTVLPDVIHADHKRQNLRRPEEGAARVRPPLQLHQGRGPPLPRLEAERAAPAQAAGAAGRGPRQDDLRRRRQAHRGGQRALMVADSSFIVEGLLKDLELLREEDIITLDLAVYEVANSVWKHQHLLKDLRDGTRYLTIFHGLLETNKIRAD